MHYYFAASIHKADLNLRHLCNLAIFLESFVEVYLDYVNSRPPPLIGVY